MADGDLNHLVTLVKLALVRPSDMIANQVPRSASDFPAEECRAKLTGTRDRGELILRV
jgi:hypothetical protein